MVLQSFYSAHAQPLKTDDGGDDADVVASIECLLDERIQKLLHGEVVKQARSQRSRELLLLLRGN